MNKCFIMGKIISQVQFDFVLNSSHISIARFNVEVDEINRVSIIGYDEIADYCYWKLNKSDRVMIYGKLNSKMALEIEEIEIMLQVTSTVSYNEVTIQS